MGKKNRGKHSTILYSSNGTIRRKNRKRARVARKNIFQLMILIMLIAFFANIQNMMAYFTSSDSSINEFSIDAEYTVSFNNNGETGTMTPQVISYNVPTNLSSNTFTSTDYVFNGWNTKADGTGTGYTNGASVTNLGDITLYAQWREPSAIFDTGTNVNIKMKNLAGDNVSAANVADTNVTAIKKSTTEPADTNKTANNIVSSSTSPDPIYMWYDSGTIYWWSKDTTPALNEDTSGMFRNFSNLTDISGLESLDASTASSLQTTFADNYLMLDYSPIYNWNISNVNNVRSIFQNNYAVETLNLSNWDTSNVITMYRMFIKCYSLENLNVSTFNTAKVQDMSYMFYGCISLKELDVSSFNTSNVVSMSLMFSFRDERNTVTGTTYSCTSINLGDNFDTSKVTKMNSMFQCDGGLININFESKFDTSNVTDMKNMFYKCNNLTVLNFGDKFDTSNVTNMSYMFGSCSNLATLDIGSFDMAKVTDTGGMLYACTSLQELKTPKVYPTNTSVTIALPKTLYDSAGTAYTTLGGATTPASPTETWIKLAYTVEFNANNGTGTMPNQKIQIGTATALKENTFTRTDYIFDGWNTKADGSGTTYADRASVTNLASANGSITLYAKWKEEYEAIFDTGTNVNIKMKNLAGDNVSAANVADTNITAIKKSTAEPTSANKTASNIVSTSTSPYPIYMWYDNGTIYWWSEDTTPALNSNSSSMFFGLSNITDISGLEYWDSTKVKSFTGTFATCLSISDFSVIFNNWNTSNATNMQAMFYNCAGLTNLNIGDKFDTSNVTDMSYMFNQCTNLTSLNLGNKFDTSKVSNMNFMFYKSTNLTSLNLGSKFDTSNVTTMIQMFYDCSNLTNFELGDNFDTSSVTTMRSMFYNCSSLTILDLGDKFDTSKVSNMSYMFWGCSGLKNLDLGDKFNTSQVTTVQEMFQDCSSLTSLDLGDKFDTSKITNMEWMFCNCSSLTTLNLGDKFDTNKVTTMKGMFSGCSCLTSLDISCFNMDKVTDTVYMLSSCTSIQELKTPKIYPTNTSVTITLPKTLYDSNGTAYTTLGGATTPTSPTQTILKETWE